MVADSSFVLIVRSLVAMITPSNSPLILVVIVSFDMVAINEASSVILIPPNSALTTVERSTVFI
jgi:hypothetical protein